MLKDITLGQYFPGNSPVHKLDPRIKLVLTTLFIVMLFMARNIIALLFCFLFSLAAFLMSQLSVSLILKSLKPIIPIVIITALINMLFIDAGSTVLSFWIIKVTDKGIATSVFMCVRIICLIAGTSLLSYTTSPIMLTDGIERLFSPLKKIGMPVHEIAMMMTIALRFIPTLIEETDKIISAQKARGADMESGNLLQRIRALMPILIPLFVSAFRRAEDLALAMESRCYHGGEGRTRLKELHLSTRDFLSLALMAVSITGVICINIYSPVQWGAF